MQQNSDALNHSKTYYLDAEYWRSALYASVGMVLVGVVSALTVQNRGQGIGDLVFTAIVNAMLVVAGVSLLIPRLRIDADGIHRRLFFWYWDHWRWEQMRSGDIRAGLESLFFDAASRPFWRRSLALVFYPAEARDLVEKIIDDFSLRPEIEIPESMSLHVGYKKWEFDVRGCRQSTKAGAVVSYKWHDVVGVRVEKISHEHPGFRKLEVQFDDETIKFHINKLNGQCLESWKGARTEEILEFLSKHVSEKKFEITAQSGPPLTESEARRRLTKIDQQIRDLKKMRIFMVVLLMGVPILGLFLPNLILFVGLSIQSILLGWAMIWLMQDQIRKFEADRIEIEEWLHSEGIPVEVQSPQMWTLSDGSSMP